MILWLSFLDNMKVLKRKKADLDQKEFLILSGDSTIDSKIILHILIDDNKGEFFAKKVKERKPLDESTWEAQKGYTFPSSIFYEFIKGPDFLEWNSHG